MDIERLYALERFAKAASDWGGKWYTSHELQERRAMSTFDADFIAAANPQTILELTALIRKLSIIAVALDARASRNAPHEEHPEIPLPLCDG